MDFSPVNPQNKRYLLVTPRKKVGKARICVDSQVFREQGPMAWVVDMVSDGRYIVQRPLLEVVDCTVIYENLEPISVIVNCDCGGVLANEFPFKSNVLLSLPSRSLSTMSVKHNFVDLTTKTDAKDNISITVVKIDRGSSTIDEVKGRRSENDNAVRSKFIAQVDWGSGRE